MTKRILIVGAGAVGAFYGGKLSQYDQCEVSVVTSSQFETVQKNGYSIKSKDGDFSFKPKQVFPSVDAVSGSFDYVVLTTKVLPTIDSVTLLKSVVSPQSTIVLIQNGIHVEDPILAHFPTHSVISGLAFICVSRSADGHIHHQDYGRLVLGSYPSGISDECQWLGDVFNQVGISCQVTDDVKKARWKKLIWNAPFNPISVLSGGKTTRDILSNPHTYALVKDVMTEVQQAARLDGVEIEDAVVEKNIRDTLDMTPYKTSMLLDLENGRPMEVEAILGNCIRFAESHQVSLPYLKSLYALLYIFAEK